MLDKEREYLEHLGSDEIPEVKTLSKRKRGKSKGLTFEQCVSAYQNGESPTIGNNVFKLNMKSLTGLLERGEANYLYTICGSSKLMIQLVESIQQDEILPNYQVGLAESISHHFNFDSIYQNIQTSEISSSPLFSRENLLIDTSLLIDLQVQPKTIDLNWLNIIQRSKLIASVESLKEINEWFKSGTIKDCFRRESFLKRIFNGIRKIDITESIIDEALSINYDGNWTEKVLIGTARVHDAKILTRNVKIHSFQQVSSSLLSYI